MPTGNWGVKIESPGDSLTRAFGGKGFVIHDKIYEMGEPFTRSDRRVLLTLELADPGVAEVVRGIPGKEQVYRADRDFAVAWVKRYGEGKVFYASFGHIAEPFENPAIRAFLPGRHSVRAGRSRRDESMITSAWLKARPRSGTGI